MMIDLTPENNNRSQSDANKARDFKSLKSPVHDIKVSAFLKETYPIAKPRSKSLSPQKRRRGSGALPELG